MKQKITTYPYEVVRKWTSERLYQKRCEARNIVPGISETLVTAVIPIFKSDNPVYMESLDNTIKKVSKNLDVGGVNEILASDGTGSTDKPDEKFDISILEKFIDSSKEFRKQLKDIKESRNVKSLSKRGYIPLLCQILNQKNPAYYETLIEYIGPRFGREIGKEHVQIGKGSGVKLPIPASRGDILCYNDSDVKTFEPYYVSGLVLPILADGKEFVKATFIRSGIQNKSGGRCKRLVYDPWIYAFVENGKFVGLEELTYGLSGEFAITRPLANKINFSEGFKIETAMNTQVYHILHSNLEKIGQSDFGIYEHCSSDVDEDRETGEDKKMLKMSTEVSYASVYAALDSGLTMSEKEFFDIYERQVFESIRRHKNMIENSKLAQKEGITYDIEQDIKRYKYYIPGVKRGTRNAIQGYKQKRREKGIPPWNDVKNLIGDKQYREFKEEFLDITTNYTTKLLEDAGFI